MEKTKITLKSKSFSSTCTSPQSETDRAIPSFSEENKHKSLICPYCGSYFHHSSGMYRHKMHQCHKRPKPESSQIKEQHDIITTKPQIMIKIKPHLLTPDIPTNNFVQHEPNKITEIVSQLRETQKQMTLILQKQEEERRRQEEERRRQEERREREEEEKQKQEEDRRQLLEIIQNLSKTQGTQTNITINNNVTFFFNSNLDLYDKKKKAHGAQAAIEFLHQTLVEARPSNKFSWILDRDIIGTSQSPLSINENGEFVVHTSEKEAKVCSLSQINQLGNASMSTSVMHAVSDSIGIYTERFSKTTDEERERTEDFFAPLHSGPFGHDILGNLVKYREMNPTQKHVVDIAGGTKIKQAHH